MKRIKTVESRRRAVLATAGLIFGIALVGLLKDRLARSSRYDVGPVRIEMGPLPESLRGHRDRLLAGSPLLAGPRSVFDRTLPEDIRSGLLDRPWVRSVSKIRRRLPNGFRVEIGLRTPVAVVCIGRERLAVDAGGVVLEADSGFGPPQFPEIHLQGENVRWVPVDGATFQLDSVKEGLAVLADLEKERLRGHTAFDSMVVAAVIVGRNGTQRRAGSADIQLVLQSGVTIAWGRSSLSPLHIFELSADDKLDHLNRLRRTYPGLLGIDRVDLRFADPMVYMRTS